MLAHPGKVKQISNLSEYDEKAKQVRAIQIYDISCGKNHCAAILDNAITEKNVEYGRDLLMWGMNMEGQLNRVDGKKGSVAVPAWTKAIDYDGGIQAGRLQLAPKGWVKLANGKKVLAEQSVVCGPNVTAVYTKICD